MQRVNVMKRDKVSGGTLSPDGIIIGAHNISPIINTLTFDVNFEDRHIREYVSTAIGGNMIAITDDDGHISMPFHAVLNHRVYETTCELKDKHASVNDKEET